LRMLQLHDATWAAPALVQQAPALLIAAGEGG
jgi:hypothetical protein